MAKKRIAEDIRKQRPRDIRTKEELISYIKSNINELPFDDEVWQMAVVKARENEQKEVPFKIVTEVMPDGTVKERKQTMGIIVKNPVSIYWQLQSLPQYTKRAKLKLAEMNQSTSESAQDITNTYFEDGAAHINVVTFWIESFKNYEEKRFLQQRYANYYDNYDINDGADIGFLMVILGYELDVYRFSRVKAAGQDVNSNDLVRCTKALQEALDAMKWTKKQRTNKDEIAQNRFTILMDKECVNGAFATPEVEYPKDEIDFLLNEIPVYMSRMDYNG